MPAPKTEVRTSARLAAKREPPSEMPKRKLAEVRRAGWSAQPLLSSVNVGKGEDELGETAYYPRPDLLCNVIYASPARRKLPSARRENALACVAQSSARLQPRASSSPAAEVPEGEGTFRSDKAVHRLTD